MTPGEALHRGVYDVRMARVNVYLPDDLAAAVRAAELNVSQITQAALTEALAAGAVDRWLEDVARLPPTGVTAAAIVDAVRAAREELGR